MKYTHLKEFVTSLDMLSQNKNITTNITLGNKNDVITISPFAVSFPRTKIAKWLIVY